MPTATVEQPTPEPPEIPPILGFALAIPAGAVLAWFLIQFWTQGVRRRIAPIEADDDDAPPP